MDRRRPDSQSFLMIRKPVDLSMKDTFPVLLSGCLYAKKFSSPKFPQALPFPKGNACGRKTASRGWRGGQTGSRRGGVSGSARGRCEGQSPRRPPQRRKFFSHTRAWHRPSVCLPKKQRPRRKARNLRKRNRFTAPSSPGKKSRKTERRLPRRS